MAPFHGRSYRRVVGGVSGWCCWCGVCGPAVRGLQIVVGRFGWVTVLVDTERETTSHRGQCERAQQAQCNPTRVLNITPPTRSASRRSAVNTVSDCEGRVVARCSFCMQVQVRLLPAFCFGFCYCFLGPICCGGAGVVRARLLAPSAPLDEPSALSDLSSALNLVIVAVQIDPRAPVRNTLIPQIRRFDTHSSYR